MDISKISLKELFQVQINAILTNQFNAVIQFFICEAFKVQIRTHCF